MNKFSNSIPSPLPKGRGDFFAFLLIASLLVSGCAGSKSSLKLGKTAEGEVVEAEGLAPNTKDTILTKRASLLDAQRNAIEKAVGVFVSGKTLVEKAVAIENNILAHSDGYIKKYDVIKEWVDGDLYKTRIRALVALKALEQDLKDMALLKTSELKRPRVALSITEQIDKVPSTDDTVKTAMEQALASQGFVVVEDEAKEEAEITIKGKASSFPFQAEGLGGFVSYRARLAVQATRTGTSNVLVAVTREASGLGGNSDLAGLKSLETVGDLVGKELGVQLADKWVKGKNIIAYLEGATSFEKVDRVRKHLEMIPGVKDIVLRSYDDDAAQFELQLDGVQPTELAASLEKSQTFPLKVLETKPQYLRLSVE